MNKSQRESLSAERRVIWVFVVSALAGILLVGGALRYFLQRAALAQCRTHLESMAGVLAQQCESEMEDARQDLEFLAKLPAFRKLPYLDLIDPSINGVPENVDVEKRQILAQLMNKATRFSVLQVVAPNSDIYLLHPFRVQAAIKKGNLADRPYYQEAARNKKTALSDSFVGAEGIPVVVIFVPILDDSREVTGYLGGICYLSRLSQLVSKERIRPFDAGFIVDRKGQLTAHTDAELLKEGSRERFIEQHPLVPSFLASAGSPAGPKPGEVLFAESPRAGGAKRHLAAFVSLRSGWGLCLMRDRAAILAEVRPMVWGITFLAGLLLAVIGALGVTIAHGIGRRWDSAEHALRISEERFRIAAETANDVVYEWDLNQSIQWQGKIDEMLGYEPGEFPRTLEGWAASLHPEDLKRVMADVHAQLEGGAPYISEYRVRRKDGAYRRWAARGAVARTPEGKPVRWIGSVTDITERKRAEAALSASEVRYRRLFEAARDGILILDAETGMIVDVNPFLIEMLGYSHTAFLGKKVWELGFFKDIVANQANFAELQQKEYIRYEDKPMETADGRRIEVEFISNFYLGSDRKVIQCNLRNITERKKSEAQLKRTLADLERSNKDLEHFAYVASHDLQEPLRMISSYTQLLAQRYADQLDDKAKKFINYAVDGSLRMQALINDLLAYSRVGTRSKLLEPTDSHAALGEAIENLAATIKEHQAIITNDVLPTVHGDASQLVLVFQNLLANAIKFRGKDHPRIHVSTRSQDHEWVFSVKDNGIGIEPRYAERVFVIFQRLHTREEYPGTGIGLAVCKRIVERHGGKIWFESEPGNGATFFFTVPK